MPYTPNVLNDYSNYSYRIRIFMLPPLMARYGEYQNSGIMIADTASNARYNIQSMEQINHLGFSIARNSFANNFTIRIAETNGITLYETLAEAAGQLGIENYIANAKYVIEVSFPGRQQDGTSIGVSGPYAIPVTFIKLDANITSTGTMYDIEAVEISTNASSYVLGTLRETVAFTATTVGEAIVAFQNIINEQEEASLLANQNAISRNDYTIQFDENAREWADWQIEFDEETPGANDVNGTRQFQVIAGTSFNEFFTRILTNTREFKSYPVITGGYAAPNPDGPVGNFDLKVFYKVISNETDMEFDPLAGTYAKDVTFVIKKFITPNLTVNANEVTDYLQNENIQTLRVQHLLGLGLLKKRYDYLYTGKNTEVINLDIKLENTFFMVAPSMGGQVYSARLANKLQSSTDRIEIRQQVGGNVGATRPGPGGDGYRGDAGGGNGGGTPTDEVEELSNSSAVSPGIEGDGLRGNAETPTQPDPTTPPFSAGTNNQPF